MITCPLCGGDGSVSGCTCPACNGTGRLPGVCRVPTRAEQEAMARDFPQFVREMPADPTEEPR